MAGWSKGSAGFFMAAFFFGAVLLGGCGGDSQNTTARAGLPREIVIGAAIGKTGYLAPYDANIAAIEQLVKETNMSGGIDGSQVRIVQADNHSEPQQAPIATQKVIEEGADVLLLSCEALTAAAAAPVAEEHEELNFTMCANEPGFGPPNTGRLSFSGSPSLASEAAAEATFLRQKGVKHPFLLRDTSISLGQSYCGDFEQVWEHFGLSVAGSADFKNEDASIATQIGQVKNSDADAVVLCSYPPGGAAAIKQIRAAGIDLPIGATASFDGTFWQKGIPNLGKIYVTINGSAYDPADEQTARLFRNLKKAGVNTDVGGALLASYAAGQLILDAVRETGSVNGPLLAHALEAHPHQTIVGKVEYTSSNHYPSRVWPIYEFVNGHPKFIREVHPKFIPESAG